MKKRKITNAILKPEKFSNRRRRKTMQSEVTKEKDLSWELAHEFLKMTNEGVIGFTPDYITDPYAVGRFARLISLAYQVRAETQNENVEGNQ